MPSGSGIVRHSGLTRRTSSGSTRITATHQLRYADSLVAAVEEERFTRLKHDTSFPHGSIRYCLETAGLRPADIDHFALSRNPRANLGRRVVHALKDRAGRQVATKRASNLRKILRAKATLAEGLGVPESALRAKPHFVEHHVAHIGSSFYVSPFERAAVLSIDGSATW